MSCLNYGWFLVYWCISRSYLILQSNPLSGRCVNDVNEQDCGRFVQKPGALLGRLTRSANYSIILSLPENASSTLCLVGDWFFQSGQIDPVYVIHPINHFGRSTCHHTCKKREIVEIYLHNLFWIFRKILGWECEINTAPKPSPEVAPSNMEVAPF